MLSCNCVDIVHTCFFPSFHVLSLDSLVLQQVKCKLLSEKFNSGSPELVVNHGQDINGADTQASLHERANFAHSF